MLPAPARTASTASHCGRQRQPSETQQVVCIRETLGIRERHSLPTPVSSSSGISTLYSVSGTILASSHSSLFQHCCRSFNFPRYLNKQRRLSGRRDRSCMCERAGKFGTSRPTQPYAKLPTPIWAIIEGAVCGV